MKFIGILALTAALLTVADIVDASEPARMVVAVRYVVSEQSPDRVEEKLTSPLERAFIGLVRVDSINSETSHGTVAIEIQFEGGATLQDLAAVNQRIKDFPTDPHITVTSRTAELAVARLLTQ